MLFTASARFPIFSQAEVLPRLFRPTTTMRFRKQCLRPWMSCGMRASSLPTLLILTHLWGHRNDVEGYARGP